MWSAFTSFATRLSAWVAILHSSILCGGWLTRPSGSVTLASLGSKQSAIEIKSSQEHSRSTWYPITLFTSVSDWGLVDIARTVSHLHKLVRNTAKNPAGFLSAS